MSKNNPSRIKEHSAYASSNPVVAKNNGSTLLSGMIKVVWVVTLLIWPVLKWVLSIMTFFQGVRMLYHWSTPGMYAGWSFIAHFTVLTAITYFVGVYKPKGF